jgi:hypothetical protein
MAALKGDSNIGDKINTPGYSTFDRRQLPLGA